MQRRFYNICERRRSFSQQFFLYSSFWCERYLSVGMKFILIVGHWLRIRDLLQCVKKLLWTFIETGGFDFHMIWRQVTMGLKCRKFLIYVFGDLFKDRLMLVFLVNQPDWGSFLASMWTETQIFFLTSDKKFNSLDIARYRPFYYVIHPAERKKHHSWNEYSLNRRSVS